jgi:hypothetical protein
LDEPVDQEDPAVKYDLAMDQYVPFWPVPPAKPFAWYLELYQNNLITVRELVRRHNRPFEEKARGSKVLTYRLVMAHHVEHDSYHGGQIVLIHEAWKQSGKIAES